MDCMNCDGELYWHGDETVENLDSEMAIESTLYCPKCKTIVLVYTPKELEDAS